MRSSALKEVLPTTTKIGAGDKERAYVVRQNSCLKILLGIICLMGTLTTVLLYTRYEVHVQRRISIQGAKNHREEEHASHMRVMRLSMLLQRHLEDEVHDVAVLTTYRAWLMRAVGDYQMRVLEQTSNCSDTMRSGVQAEGVRFDVEIEKLLKLLWDDVVKEGKQAQKQLHNITHAIVSELRTDATEQGEYERVMQEAGEDAGLLGYHNHEVEYRGHLDGADHPRHHRCIYTHIMAAAAHSLLLLIPSSITPRRPHSHTVAHAPSHPHTVAHAPSHPHILFTTGTTTGTSSTRSTTARAAARAARVESTTTTCTMVLTTASTMASTTAWTSTMASILITTLTTSLTTTTRSTWRAHSSLCWCGCVRTTQW